MSKTENSAKNSLELNPERGCALDDTGKKAVSKDSTHIAQIRLAQVYEKTDNVKKANTIFGKKEAPATPEKEETKKDQPRVRP